MSRIPFKLSQHWPAKLACFHLGLLYRKFFRKIHLSRKIHYVEFNSTSFSAVQNVAILGRITERRIRR